MERNIHINNNFHQKNQWTMRAVITIRKFMKHLSKKHIKHGKTSMLQLIYGPSWCYEKS